MSGCPQGLPSQPEDLDEVVEAAVLVERVRRAGQRQPGLARHLGEHAVVADDQRNLAAVGPLAHGDAHVAGLPGFHRHPGVELAVVQAQLALVVDDEAGVVFGLTVVVDVVDLVRPTAT